MNDLSTEKLMFVPIASALTDAHRACLFLASFI